MSKRAVISTKVEDEPRSSVSAFSDNKTTKFSGIAESDESDIFFRDFDLEDAWDELQNLEGCFKVVLDEQQQKDIGVQVGVNVSHEFPWKQVKCKILREYMPEEPYIPKDEQEDKMAASLSTTQQLPETPERFSDIKPDDPILIGYAPMLAVDDGDVFFVYTNFESAKTASGIIKTIEEYQHWLLNKIMMKRNRAWISHGSEAAVDLGRPPDKRMVVDVEIQSVYPIKHPNSMFQHRFSEDVRDGYVELVPGEKKFENVFRRRIDVAIQSAPKRVDLAQQTDPTFPSNAWSQYLYEINPDDEGLDCSDDEKDDGKKKKSKPSSRATSPTKEPPESQTPEPPKPPPDMSNQMKVLLETLDFNQVDMYRNDYPLISDKRISKYTVPFLKEILCFANISLSNNRYVCGIGWYPTLSGLLVASYTFSTEATTASDDLKVDPVKRAVIEPNPVLMWSLKDSLHHTFEFKTPREVTVLTFCPYDDNLLLGGTTNGQIIIWDLQGRIVSNKSEKVRTAAQIRYRNIMHQYLDWTKMPNESVVFHPAAISDLKHSHGGPVTQIRWLSQNNYISTSGQARSSEKATYRFFVTTSMCGTVAFWNLDAPVERKDSASSGASKTVPKQLMQDVSAYKKFDRTLRPVFVVDNKEPITSCIFNRGKFEYSTDNRVEIQVKAVAGRPFEQSMGVSTMTGHIRQFGWDGFDFVPSGDVNSETITIFEEFAPIHDGPVLEVRRNPFCDTIYASVGKNVLAIWSEACLWTPIFWRMRPAAITRLEWSLDRPGLLFLCRKDGTFEAWDLIARTDDASLTDQLSGGVITALSEHWPIAEKMIAVGDYNSSLRLLALPPAFRSKLPMEAERLTDLINHEHTRKEAIKNWEEAWLTKNADLLHAKKQQELQAVQEFERLKRESEQQELQTKHETGDAQRTQSKTKKKLVYDFTERLEKKWDEMNLKRMINLLMARRSVDHEKLAKETAMEKARLAYEESKKRAIKGSFKMIDEEVAAIRARLLPLVVESKERMEMATESAHAIVDEGENYATMEARAEKMVTGNPVDVSVSFSEFLERGRQRRQLVDKSLGATTQRRHWLDSLREKNLIRDLDLGYKEFVEKLSPVKSDVKLEGNLEEEIKTEKEEEEEE